MRGGLRGRSRAHRSRLRRIAQDCDPTAYSCTPSGRTDAQGAQAAQGARLPRNPPHADKAKREGLIWKTFLAAKNAKVAKRLIGDSND